jgi:hypothetical protein
VGRPAVGSHWPARARTKWQHDRQPTRVSTTGTIVRTDDELSNGHARPAGLHRRHTPNATLVASKHDEEQIRQVVKELEKRGWTEYL